MIEHEFYTERLIKYCELAQIPIVKGIIEEKYLAQIKSFLHTDQRVQKNITRSRENDLSVARILIKNDILNKLAGKIILSPMEEYVWNALEREKLTNLARRQFGIGSYKIDIAFPISKLAIECDGHEYHRENQEQLERDQKRDKYLAKKGWMTIRLSGMLIRNNINACIEKIKGNLEFAT